MRALIPLLEGRLQPATRLGRAVLWVLAGIGFLHGMVQRMRAAFYRWGILPSYRPPCPVISVGNLAAGGTGKTPMVLWLARQILAAGCGREQTGTLAIVSRGYGVSSRAATTKRGGVTLVAAADGLRLTPPQAADEAVLLARHLPGVVVLTGPNRADLIRCAVEQHGARCILLDDGFQHLRVQRDLDLVLLDARYPFGNGHLLPGGILREYPAALHRCDAICLTRAGDGVAVQKNKALLQKMFPEKPVLLADHQPRAWVRLGVAEELAIATLEQTKVLAFCGIARPDSFADLLAATKTSIRGWHTFPDHFAFSRADLDGLRRAAYAVQAQALVCTEKDAVKIAETWLPIGELPLFFLRMELVFLENPRWLQTQLEQMAARS